MVGNPNPSELLVRTRNIVVAHVANTDTAAGDLENLISSVYTALASAPSSEVAAERPAPAVPIKKSVTRNHIICLEDGKKLRMLKRYLRSRYGLTPEEYRKRWGLPADYPMVAPTYSAQRSALAKKIGLGKRRGKRRRRT